MLPIFQRLLGGLGIRSSPSQTAEIPEDLQIEILSKVPAESVTRFRGLSKFHRTLIDSPYFIRKHCESSTKATTCKQIILWRLNTNEGVNDVVMLDLTKFGEKEERFAIPLEDEHLYIVGCCAGILCLMHYPNQRREDRRILLWNPLTGSVGGNIPVKDPIGNWISYYFGHDEVTDDWKILKVEYKHPFSDCEIYSCRTGCWRKISVDNHWPELFPSNCGIFVEGTNSLHMRDTSEEYRSIIAFNYSSEKFNKILVPLECTETHSNWSLSEFHGYLGIDIIKQNNGGLSVWVMKEYGVEGSWSCLFSLDHSCTRVIKSLGLVNDGRQLLLSGDDCGLYVYDFEKKEVGNSPMIQKSEPYIFQPFAYTPSIRRV